MSTETLPEATLDRLAQAARDTLSRSRNCAQTSFAVLQEEFNLDGGPILKALTPFPGIACLGTIMSVIYSQLWRKSSLKN